MAHRNALNDRRLWLVLYLSCLFALLPVAPWVWRRWLVGPLGAYLTLDAIHVGEYVVLGWLIRWSRWTWAARPRHALWLLAGIAVVDELVQGILPNRFADLRDWLCDWIGGLAGYAAHWLICKKLNHNTKYS